MSPFGRIRVSGVRKIEPVEKTVAASVRPAAIDQAEGLGQIN